MAVVAYGVQVFDLGGYPGTTLGTNVLELFRPGILQLVPISGPFTRPREEILFWHFSERPNESPSRIDVMRHVLPSPPTSRLACVAGNEADFDHFLGPLGIVVPAARWRTMICLPLVRH